MKHIDDINALIRTLHESSRFHALILQSPPGWAKSTTVEQALAQMRIAFHILGSYSTPLQLYNAIHEFPRVTIVVDDCAGLFGHPTAMAILKAATWSSAGTNGSRLICWRSGSGQVSGPAVKFEGKLILLTNSMPCGPDTDALLSRSLYLSIDFTPEEIEEMLFSAASQKEYYDDTELALKVADRLVGSFAQRDKTKLNFRTLQVGYELAKLNPQNWINLLERLIPPTLPEHLVRKLSQSSASVEVQARKFCRTTGLSRRTFFTYRRALGLRRRQSYDGSEKVQIAQL